MNNALKSLLLLVSLSIFGACERVKDKETVARLPETSVEDTLVLTPDTLEIDTAITQPSVVVDIYSDAKAQNVASTGNSAGSSEPSTPRMASSPIARSEAPLAVKTSSAGTVSKTSATSKKYVRPTPEQLQRSLALDARKSSKMDLPTLKDYWLTRQHYYRRATKNVKYVVGDTKIKISQEDTKIETPLGKVKIEGDDIKIKYD